MSIGVIAKLFVRAEKENEFVSAFARLEEAVNSKESGCEFYKLYKSEEENTYIVLESYTDEDALQAHQQTEHYKSIGAELASLMADKPKLTVMPSTN